MKKLLLILLFICVIFSSCQSNDDWVQDDENFESSESSSISENISDESESDTTINNLCDLSYDEYFSKEYPYEDTSLDFVDENMGYNIGEANNLYFLYFDDKNGFKHTIASNVDDFGIVYDELIYSVKGTTLYSATLHGTDPKEIYKLPSDIDGEISRIFCTPELIWMKIEDSIYRLHRSSGILDKIYSNPEMKFFRPLSNYSIEYDIVNPKWTEHLESGGSTLDWVPFKEEITYIYNSKTGEDYEASFLDVVPYTIIYDIE